MIIAIDIGNTAVSVGLMKGSRVIRVVNIETALSSAKFKVKFRNLLKIFQQKFLIKAVIICSVVPSITKVTARVVQSTLNIKPIIIGRDLKVPIKNHYDDPQKVGQDRLVGAYAAKILYGFPAIIIDFGTAITFDVVSHKGEYEGGMIIPGIRLSVESLYRKTALLPLVHKIKIPKVLIGKNTNASILSGIFYGYGTMCAGLIDLISRKMNGRPKVIVTGGYTHLMKKFIARKITKIDTHLVFKGMKLLYDSSLK